MLANDSDPDQGDSLTVTIIDGPNKGSVTVNPNGTVTYNANNQGGNTSFTYRISDGRGGTAAATVYIDLVNN